MNYVISIIKEYKKQLLLIYFYVFLVQMIFLAEPYVLGKMIDGLLNKEYGWLLTFIALLITGDIFTYKRMVYDTKIYTKIYNKLVFNYLDHDKTSDSSAKNARTDMTNNIINFLENDIAYYIMSIISVFGSLFFIFIQNSTTGFVVFLCVIPVLLIVKLFYKKIAQGTRAGHTLFEQKMQIMDSNNRSLIHTFFNRRQRIIIAQSTIQGKNWTALQVVRGVFLILALIIFTSTSEELTQGEVVSMYSYIFQFLISLMSIPIGMETFTRMKDVIDRIKKPV